MTAARFTLASTLLLASTWVTAQTDPAMQMKNTAQALESCLSQAIGVAAKSTPRPNTDDVMNRCNPQWASFQQLFPADTYNSARDHARTVIGQQLAAATTTPQ